MMPPPPLALVDDHDDGHDNDDAAASQTNGANLKPEAVVHALKDIGDFVVAGDEAFWISAEIDPTDPDKWPVPLAVKGAAFHRMLSSRWNKLASKNAKKTKEVVEACEIAAYKSKRLPLVQWAQWTGSALQVVVSPSFAIEIDAQGVRPVRNGEAAIYKLSSDFTPLSWRALMDAWRTEDGFMLPRLRFALTDHLPPPVETDWPLDIRQHAPSIQAATIMGYWMGLFTEPLTKGRPILSIIGAYQSGKSVTARILGKLYYGPDFDVGGGVGGSRAVKDLVASMNACPFVVRDDMNREPIAIVDTICRIATGSRVELANMHETLSFSTYSLRSSLCVTAHTPEWALRPDLLSRMLVLRISRSDTPPTITETQRYERADKMRTAVWSDTLYALHRAMQVHTRWEGITRFEDWESWVRRAAEAGGWHLPLHHGLQMQERLRVNLATDTDPWLAAVQSVAQDMAVDGGLYYTANELYDLVSMKLGAVISADTERRPSAQAMRNQRALGIWLGHLERDGQAVVNVLRGPLRHGIATWRMLPKA